MYAAINFMNADLIIQRAEGLYCPVGDFYIDPWQPVDRAVITHAHSDHALRGNAHYLAAAPAEAVLVDRLAVVGARIALVARPVVGGQLVVPIPEPEVLQWS